MKTIIVEDQTLFRDFLRDFIDNEPDFTLVGEASDGNQALKIIREVKPELVILDILIPEKSGLVVAKTLRQEFPWMRLLAISCECDEKTLFQVQKLHLEGFVDKNTLTIEHFREVLQKIKSRERYVSPTLALTMKKIVDDPQSFPKILTRREHQILGQIGGGFSDQSIGEVLGLSASSVQTHRRNIMRKLNVHSTPELIQIAQEKGFWKPEFNKMNLKTGYHIFPPEV